ncbi:MAG: TusE/DsrC/DsvC family sulfur relay protein [Sedimenticola sp.]
MPISNPLATEKSTPPKSFDEWNQELAVELAKEESIELSSEHWAVIHFLRHHCESNGTTCSARLLLKAMMSEFKQQGGKRYLYTLFPRGPVVQATKIAGIPLPAHSLDLSFGSVH